MKVKTDDIVKYLPIIKIAAGLDATLVLTSVITLMCKNDKLTLVSTDMINTLYVDVPIQQNTDDGFEVSVDAKTFIALMSKLSTEQISLTVRDTNLIIRSGGMYKLPIILNSYNQPAVIEDVRQKYTSNMTLSLDIVRKATNTLSKSLPTGVLANVLDVYNNYYLGEVIMTSDTNNLSIMRTSTSLDRLISSHVMQILSKFDSDINMSDEAYFTDNIVLVSAKQSVSDDYQASDLLAVADTLVPICKINTDVLKAAITRIAIFNEKYVLLKIDSSCELVSMHDTFVEPLCDDITANPVTYKIDVSTLKTYARLISDDSITLSMTSGAIGLSSDDCTHIISTMEE